MQFNQQFCIDQGTILGQGLNEEGVRVGRESGSGNGVSYFLLQLQFQPISLHSCLRSKLKQLFSEI